SPQEGASVALRLKVHGIITDDQGGRFGLAASQTAPFNAFVSGRQLSHRVEATNRANLLIAGHARNPVPALGPVPAQGPGYLVPHRTTAEQLALLARALRQRWQLDDAELTLVDVPAAHATELRTSRVFLDAPVSAAVFGPGTNSLSHRLGQTMPFIQAGGVLTYFVNELRVGDRAAPYSMVSAIAPSRLPEGMADDEVLINQWLADDLGARVGDELALRYFEVGEGRALIERSAALRIRGIVPMTALGLDRELMPDFPGMTDADSCRDWDTGLPIDSSQIRDVDEQYWTTYRGTPKAIVTLKAGQKLWENRFGNLTAIRFHNQRYVVGDSGVTTTNQNPSHLPRFTSILPRLRPLMAQSFDPGMFGLSFQPVREQALLASSQSQDFGQLFLGFSFFLIAAALLLMSVLFQFGIEQRASQVGTLLALGFTPRRVRWLLLGEGAFVAMLGGLLGAWGGLGYARAMLEGLSTIWTDAVAGAVLDYHLAPTTLATGVLASAAVSWLTLWLALRKQLQRPARELLSSGAELELEGPARLRPDGSVAPSRRAEWIAAASLVGALGLLGWGIAQNKSAAAGLFFGSGALLLIAGLAACSAWLTRLATASGTDRLTPASLAVRGVTRRRRRSLSVIGLLACGSFLIASIGVFRLDAVRDATRRDSGTGGFALIGASTQPVVEDLNSPSARELFNLDTNLLAGVGVVPFRVQDGDEASCLNLNRAQRPRLLGVKPEHLADRGAFSFARVATGAVGSNPWSLLDSRDGLQPDEVPAIGDAASIQWALGKKVGDTLPYRDERGQEFKLRLVGAVANSILQGSLVIAESDFIRRFPSVTGYRMFLIDAPSNALDPVAAELTRGLRDEGLELTGTVERLAAFNAVQNTYLGTFQVLGGLGLILGSIGLGVVVLRNVLERRGELAVLLAVGLRREVLRRMVLIEHGALLAAGLVVGVLAALVAVAPALLAPGQSVPYVSLGLTL
ncbi:MAG: FtsX-like permease family protein, partial [Limisphaerales bacterium]